MNGQLGIAVRTLGRHRGFTAVAVLSLAVAIALNTTMYSVLETLLVPPLNVRSPENVFRIRYFGDRKNVLGPQGVEQTLAAGLRSYEGVTGAATYSRPVVGGGPTRAPLMDSPLVESGTRFRRVMAVVVRPNYFDFLGARPVAGRTFLPRDSDAPVTVISDRFARFLFDDRTAIGQSVKLDGRDLTVIGIVERAPSFEPLNADMWVLRTPSAPPIPVTLIRMRDRVDSNVVKSELAVISARLALAVGESQYQNRFHFTAIGRRLELRGFHRALIAAVLAILLVACANLANLQLARGLARSRELALRSAVGASRRQLIGHLLIESGILAVAGLALGVVLTLWGIALVTATIPPEIESHVVAPITSWRMFAFAAAVGLVCLFLVGLLPALHVSRVDPDSLLKSTSGTGANRAHRRRYGIMIVAQIALALPVLIGALVSFRSALRLHSGTYFAREWFGYDPRPVVAGGYSMLADRTLRGVRLMELSMELTARATRVPGIQHAAIEVWRAPIRRMVTVDDANGVAREMMAHQWSYAAVSPSYFRAFGRTMERGRDFTEGEFGYPSVIMDAPTARFLWGNDNPIGRSIKFANADSDAPWYRVVGILGDMRDTFTIRRVMPDANYRLYSVYRVIAPTDSVVIAPGQSGSVALYARASGNTELASMRLQREMRIFRPKDRVTAVPFEGWISSTRVRTAFVASLFSAFAFLGLALVAIGVYGIVTHSVAERRRELAVRISLGATSRNILNSVLREGNVLILAGIALGLLSARYSIWWLGGFILDADGYDAVLFGLIASGLFAVAALAAFVPAWRATRIDPVEALRHE